MGQSASGALIPVNVLLVSKKGSFLLATKKLVAAQVGISLQISLGFVVSIFDPRVPPTLPVVDLT